MDRDRARLALGVAGPAAFALVVLALGALEPGYDHARDVLSELGARGAANPLAMNALGFGGLGASMALFALALRRSAVPGARGAAPWLLALSGAAVVAVGLLPCDPGCHQVSLVGELHTRAASVSGAAGFAALALFARAMRGAPGWEGHLRLTLACLAGLAVFGGLYSLGAAGYPVLPWQGALQRGALASSAAWTVATAARLLRR